MPYSIKEDGRKVVVEVTGEFDAILGKRGSERTGKLAGSGD